MLASREGEISVGFIGGKIIGWMMLHLTRSQGVVTGFRVLSAAASFFKDNCIGTYAGRVMTAAIALNLTRPVKSGWKMNVDSDTMLVCRPYRLIDLKGCIGRSHNRNDTLSVSINLIAAKTML